MNSNIPLVSVIIPCYNQGQYLHEAVTSVLSQTYQNLEIIIVNDGSTEVETIEIFNNYQPPKTKLIHTTNQGVCRARNTAIAASRGKYILPLDADDKIAPTYLEKAVPVLEKNAYIGIVYCETQLFGEKQGTSTSSTLPDIFIGKDKLPEILIYNRIHNSALYRKSDWDKVSGYNTNMIYGLEDYDFWLSILETGKKSYLIPEYLYFWRRAKKSRSTQAHDHLALCYTQLFHNHSQLYFDNIGFVFQYIFDTRQVYKQFALQHRQETKKLKAELKNNQKETNKLQKDLKNATSNLKEIKKDLKNTTSNLNKLKTDLKNATSNLKEIRTELKQAKSRIKTMEKSKFWKLRNQWFKFKHIFSNNSQVEE